MSDILFKADNIPIICFRDYLNNYKLPEKYHNYRA